MTTEFTNYGSFFYTQSIAGGASGSPVSTLVAEVLKIEPPVIKMPKIKTTNHGSGSFDTFIAAGVAEIEDFGITLVYSGSSTSAMFDTMVAGTLGYYKIAFTNSQDCYFGALITEWGAEEADAQSPELLKAVVTFSPTGEMLIE